MILIFTSLLLFILLSRVFEHALKIPTTLSLLLLSFFVNQYYPDFITLSDREFDEILYLMLPLILLPDVLNLSIVDIRKHYKVILYMAVFSVAGSITLAVFITPLLLPEIQWTIGMLISLFAMLMATDAITVSSIMSKFSLPERLKIYAESESLFNDVTALVIFYFIGLPLLTGEGVGVLNINFTLIKVLFVSISLGLVSAWVGYLATKILKDTVEQFILIYLVVNISFLLAEHFHAAGILAIVSSVMSFKLLIQKELQRSGRLPKITTDGAEGYASLISWIRKIPAITRKDFRVYRKEAMFIGIFANAGVFISMAILFEPHLLQQYLTEILVIFLLTTVLRASAIIAMVRTLHLPNRWSSALTLAGSKGALAIIMVHSIPKSFVYQEMFEAIVIGIIIFTTFGYTLLLMWHVTHHKIAYQQDRQHYEHAHTPSAEELIYGLHSAIEHDELSHAYNPTYFETLLDNEIARSRRYKTELSAIMIHICSSAPPHQPIVPCETIISILGNVITGLIRNNDYFGRMDNDTFLVLVTNTGLSGTMILTERIDQLFQDQLESNTVHARYGITAFEESDSAESLKEKMKDALRRTEMKPKKNIEIEI